MVIRMSVKTQSTSAPLFATPKDFDALQTHLSDRVSSLLISLVLMVGLSVVVLGSIYLSNRRIAAPLSVVLVPEERAAGRGDHAAGFAKDFAAPGEEEIEQISEPTLQQSLEAATSMVSTIIASMDTIESLASEASHGQGGLGDYRPPGLLGDGEDIIHRSQRWELKFTARNLQAYAAQLDYFNIELAAIGGGIRTVDYASKFSGTPQRKSGNSKEEERIYFIWRNGGAMEQYDRQLLQRAGVPLQGRQVLKFLSKAFEDQLAQLEYGYAQQVLGRPASPMELAKTIFECRPLSSGGYEWVVIDQRYRKVAPKAAGDRKK